MIERKIYRDITTGEERALYGLRDADVIKRANELGVALIHAPERIFSHH
mgnify:CR=1 FL=1